MRSTLNLSLLKSFIFSLIIFSSWSAMAQGVTKVTGVIYDGELNETLPFVNVSFVGTTVGVSSDIDGNFEIETTEPVTQITASFLGYISDTIDIKTGEAQTLDITLRTTSLQLNEVTIVAKKKRYSKRNNPAVDFIKMVMKNRDQNRLEGKEHYSYEQYEKIELDINNITDDFKNRKIFNQFQFVFENMDTSEVDGKAYLPFFIKESSSKIYYRKSPKSKKEYQNAIKLSKLDEMWWDDEGMTAILDLMYQDINVYNNKIVIADREFVGPLSPIATDFYKFYIIDTIQHQGLDVVKMAFLPRNKMNLGFEGNMLVTLDGNYSIIKLDLSIMDDINMNWVEDLKITQEFKRQGDTWVLDKDEIWMDFKIVGDGIGFVGQKNSFYKDYEFDKKPNNNVFAGTNKKIIAEDAFEKGDEYWSNNRIVPLTENEESIYGMVDSIQKVPAFKSFLTAISIATTGFVKVGPVDIGPIIGFYSFNEIEGSKLRLSTQTNLDFSKKVNIKAQATYGTRDKEMKYTGEIKYTFNKDYIDNPKHEISFSLFHDTKFPGFRLELVNEANFLLSFKRGLDDQLIFFDEYRLKYLLETKSDFAFSAFIDHKRERAYGALTFNHTDDSGEIAPFGSVNATEIGGRIRWAPNEEFIQGRSYRYTFLSKYPVFTLDYSKGIKDFLQGDYNYHRLQLGIFKKFNLSFAGNLQVNLEGGKMFGEAIPYNLLFLPRANQSYFYQDFSYNMMNFIEFVNDEYVSINARYYPDGFILNKIPLIKKLKLREAFGFKMLYGRITDSNNPNLHPELLQFATRDGEPSTFTLEDEPYYEVSAGLKNIFKIIGVDFVWRLNYLDNPNIPRLWGTEGLGLRVRVNVEF